MWITQGERLHLPTLTSDGCDKLGDTERESGENCNNNNKSDPKVCVMKWRGVVCFTAVSSARAAGEQKRWGLGLLVCARLAMQPICLVAGYTRRLIGRRAFFRVTADAVCSLISGRPSTMRVRNDTLSGPHRAGGGLGEGGGGTRKIGEGSSLKIHSCVYVCTGWNQEGRSLKSL